MPDQPAKKFTITEPGVYDIPEDVYHSDPCQPESLSSSGAKTIMDSCPSIFRYEKDNPKPSTAPQKIGKAVHNWLLEGEETVSQRFAVQPDDLNLNSNAGKAFKANAAAAGLDIIKERDLDKCAAMAKALEAHPFAGAAFKNGKAEQSLFWQDERFGIWRRARPDWLPDNGHLFPDLKSCTSAHPDEIEKALGNFGYYQTAAWYLDGLRALGLAENPAYFFVFMEKDPPYEIVVVQASDSALNWGRVRNAKAMETFRRCLDSGIWPGYAADVITVGLPRWLEYRLQAEFEDGKFEIGAEAQRPLEEKQNG